MKNQEEQKNQNEVSIRELKAKAGEILRMLDEDSGGEIIVTRHGKQGAKLVSLKGTKEEIPWSERRSLRNDLTHLPDVSYKEFVKFKKIWERNIDPTL